MVAKTIFRFHSRRSWIWTCIELRWTRTIPYTISLRLSYTGEAWTAVIIDVLQKVKMGNGTTLTIRERARLHSKTCLTNEVEEVAGLLIFYSFNAGATRVVHMWCSFFPPQWLAIRVEYGVFRKTNSSSFLPLLLFRISIGVWRLSEKDNRNGGGYSLPFRY